MEYLNVPIIFRIPFMLVLVTAPIIITKYYGNILTSLFYAAINSFHNQNNNNRGNTNDSESDSENNDLSDLNEPLIESNITVTPNNVDIITSNLGWLYEREVARIRALRDRDTIHVLPVDDIKKQVDITEIIQPSEKLTNILDQYLTMYNKASLNLNIFTNIDSYNIHQLISNEYLTNTLIFI